MVKYMISFEAGERYYFHGSIFTGWDPNRETAQLVSADVVNDYIYTITRRWPGLNLLVEEVEQPKQTSFIISYNSHTFGRHRYVAQWDEKYQFESWTSDPSKAMVISADLIDEIVNSVLKDHGTNLTVEPV